MLGDLLGTLFGRTQRDFADHDYTPSVLADPSPMPAFDRLADWLPYIGWIPEDRLFLLGKPTARGYSASDIEAVGYAIGILPQTGADEHIVSVLKNLFSGLKDGCSIQVQLFASPDISSVLARYRGLRNAGGVHAEAAARHAAYLERASLHHPFPGMPWLARTFRCLLSVTVPVRGLDDAEGTEYAKLTRDAHLSVLRSAYLFDREFGPADVISWCADLLNVNKLLTGQWQRLSYDDGRLIRDQIMALDTLTRVDRSGIVQGSPRDSAQAVIRAFSVRSSPKVAHLGGLGNLIGDVVRAANAYTCPFAITLGLMVPDYETMRSMVNMRAARATQAAQSKMAAFMPEWAEKKVDWDVAVYAYQSAGYVVKAYHQILLFSRPEEAHRDEMAARGVWRACGFDLQEDTYLQMQSLMLALPMTLTRSFQAEARYAGRFRTLTTGNCVHTMPVIAEWEGVGEPVMLLFGRRGQAMPIDLFANAAGNYNACVVGTSGSGKSVFMNHLALSYLGCGARVWIIDVGRSYENMCRLVGGQFIEFTEDSALSFNPFALIEDIDEDMEMVRPILARMISPNEVLPQYELSQLEIAIRRVWYEARNQGRLPTLTDLAEDLKTACKDEEGKCDPRVRAMGIQMFPFTEDGQYGRWFTGGINVRFDADLVVLEMEELKGKKDLQGVILQMLMYLITRDIYLGRGDGRRKIVIIDEAWDLMHGASGDFIEAGYRRARKYGGAFITGTQGVDDYYKNPAAEAALNNADWLFMLRQKQESIKALESKGRLALSDGLRTLIMSLNTEADRYSEVFVHCPMGSGIGRLVLDPYTLLLSSSRQDDYAAVRAKMRSGLSVDAAVRAVLDERSGGASS